MNQEPQILRIGIDKRWTANEMWSSIKALEDLYNFRLILQTTYEDYRAWDEISMELRDSRRLRYYLRDRKRLNPFLLEALFSNFPKPLEPEQLQRISKLIYPNEQLVVRRIKYGSEGIKDLAGFGEIVGHLKDFIQFIIDKISTTRQRRLENDERELRNEEQRIKNQALRIENARNFVSLAKESGYSEIEIREMTNWVDDKQEVFLPLIEQGKIKWVEKRNNDNE